MAMRTSPTRRRAVTQRPRTSAGCRKYREPSSLMVVTESRFGFLGSSMVKRGQTGRLARAWKRAWVGRQLAAARAGAANRWHESHIMQFAGLGVDGRVVVEEFLDGVPAAGHQSLARRVGHGDREI